MRGRDLARSSAEVAMFAAVAAFAALLVLVVSGDGPRAIDARAASWVAAHREPWLTEVLEVATRAGSYVVLVPTLALAGLWLWRTRRTRVALLVFAATLGGATLLSNAFKLAVTRDRPDGPLVDAAGYAFPSGHATTSAAGWLCLAVVLGAAGTGRRRRLALLMSAIVVIAIVGYSRIYLGVHHATDVVAGWALGGLWVLVVLAVSARLADRRRSAAA